MATVTLGGPDRDERLSAMTADIRSFDSVAVMGAGVSAFAYPMTMQLPALLWQAIGEVDGAPAELARRTGRSGTPKEILGTAPETVALGWQLVRDILAVRQAFQRAFANLDAERDPSQAHRALARLIHEGRLQLVISYNWDSCLERAHEDIYGIPLPPGVLVKPHGDVLARTSLGPFPMRTEWYRRRSSTGWCNGPCGAGGGSPIRAGTHRRSQKNRLALGAHASLPPATRTMSWSVMSGCLAGDAPAAGH